MQTFKTPRKTIRIARAALAELKATNADFFCEKLRPPAIAPSKPYAIIEYREPETSKFVYKFKITQPFPFSMERLAAEAIQSGKNAFDQAIYSATEAIGKLPRKGKGNLHMPWSQTPADMKGRVERKGIIPDALRPVIYSQEPYFTGNGYTGGDDAIRQLAQLANDKHTIGFSVNTTAAMLQLPSISGMGLDTIEIEIPRGWNSVKDEVFIARTPVKARIHDNYVVDFQIALDVAAPLGNIPAIAALDVFLNKAQSMTEALERRVTDLLN